MYDTHSANPPPPSPPLFTGGKRGGGGGGGGLRFLGNPRKVGGYDFLVKNGKVIHIVGLFIEKGLKTAFHW